MRLCALCDSVVSNRSSKHDVPHASRTHPPGPLRGPSCSSCLVCLFKRPAQWYLPLRGLRGGVAGAEAAERSAIDCALAVTPPSRSVIRFAPPRVCPNGHLSRRHRRRARICKDGPCTIPPTSSPASMSAKPDSNWLLLSPDGKFLDRDFANTPRRTAQSRAALPQAPGPAWW